MSAKDVLLCVIIPLLIAELGPWCGWLAERLLKWGAALRYGDGDRAAVRAEEWSGHLCEIPGQLSKLVYSLGQLVMGSTVAARRKIKGTGDRLGSGARNVRDLSDGEVWEIAGEATTQSSAEGRIVTASAQVAAAGAVAASAEVKTP